MHKKSHDRKHLSRLIVNSNYQKAIILVSRLMDGNICRYMSKLTLVRVRLDLTGSYKATASNEDGSEEVVFDLEVKGQR